MWIMLSLVIGLAWPASADQDEAIRSVKNDDSIQQSLPSAPAQRAVTSTPRPRERVRRQRSEAGSSIASLLLWIVLGIVVVALVIVIGREVITKPAEARPPDTAEEAPPEALKVAAGTLDDAERLAAAGRFGEAIHTLLLQTFETIGRHAALPASLTSREILRRVRAEETAIAALRQLVASVEVCIFGGDQPSAADYATCRESFERVLNARGVDVI
jgi:ferric-dicitrate binding protein FerR (iron transport regulator)